MKFLGYFFFFLSFVVERLSQLEFRESATTPSKDEEDVRRKSRQRREKVEEKETFFQKLLNPFESYDATIVATHFDCYE